MNKRPAINREPFQAPMPMAVPQQSLDIPMEDTSMPTPTNGRTPYLMDSSAHINPGPAGMGRHPRCVRVPGDIFAM